MSSINNNGKIAYMYDDQTDTWHSLAGVVNTAQNYIWQGSNTFANAVSFEDVVSTKAGVNNFQNPSQRDSILLNPTNGTVCFIRQNNDGSLANQIQYYYNGTWKNANSNVGLSVQTNNYTLSSEDAGRTIMTNMSIENSVTVADFSSASFFVGERVDIIQQGVGQTEIVPSAGVVISSKAGNKKLSSRYSAAYLVNIAQNNWILIGDLAE